MLVFVSHLYTFNFFMGNKVYVWQEYVTHLGYLGVSFFFVLSGFILFINYLGGTFKTISWRRFYVSRIARIYPAFLVTLLLALPLQLLSHQGRWFFTGLGLNLSLFQSYSAISWKSFNMPAWSVSNEMTFYLLFPLLGLLFRKKVLRNFLWSVGIFGLYLCSMNLLLGDTYYTQDRFPINRLLEFGMGMVAGYGYLRFRDHPSVIDFFQKPWATALTAIFSVLLFAAMVLEPSIIGTETLTRHFNFLYYLVFVIPFILTFALAEYHRKPMLGFSAPWIVLGGELSYGIYLLHHLVFRYEKRLITLFMPKDWVSNMPTVSGLVVLPVLLISTLGLAYWMHRYIEVPWRRKIVAKWT